MADIKNIKISASTPDKRMTVFNNEAVEIKRSYKVVNGQAVIVWDIDNTPLPTYDYYILTTWTLSSGIFSFPPIETSGKEHSGVIDWGDGAKEIYLNSSAYISHNYKVSGTYTIKLSGDFTVLYKDCFYQQTELIAIDTTKSKISNIGYRAFGECTSLNYVKFKSSTNINSSTSNCSCFYGCTSLEEIVIPYSTSFIGPSMFEKCTNLKKVTYSSATIGIGAYAFEGCSNFESFDFSKCINVDTGCIADSGISQVNLGAKFGDYLEFGLAFYQQIPVQFTFTNNNLFKIIDGCIYYRGNSSSNYTHFVYCPQNIGGDITIQSGVTRINAYAFVNRAETTGSVKINSITIPSTVTKIDNYAMHSINNYYNKTDTVIIYYEGTHSQWNEISWNYRYNTALNKAEKIFLGGEL